MNRPFCAVCGSNERPLRCAQCKKVWYCNTSHQQLAWPTHRKFCQEERRRQVQLQEEEQRLQQEAIQLQQPTTSSNDTACLDFGSEFPDISALLEDNNIIPDDIDLEKLLTEITNEVMVAPDPEPHQLQQVLPPTQPQFNSFIMGSGGEKENCFLPTVIPPFAFERRYEELCQTVISDMNTYGLSVIDDFLGREKGLQILSEVHRMYSAGVFTDGQVTAHSKEGRNLKAIRGDKIAWVKGSQDGYSNIGYLINQIDTVICRANKMNGNGQLGDYSIRERTKAMVACYPGSGTHYKMHVDNPNKDGRVITAIYYLNVDWDTKRSGGVLRIFRKQDEAVADIEPKFDRLLFFWSDIRNPHEVQPAHRTRYAITVWYFDANEREKARNRKRAAVVPSNSANQPPPYQPQLANAFT